ncbi:helix-turn-helix transcriptional regulator [Streptomyces sp. NPDC056337]|uniref:helix-turn-helix transcriptional regulator n=1 Tax=Streptomyces sp. NPDC056337 TaxID=3345787 RepID=UPI0035E02C4D
MKERMYTPETLAAYLGVPVKTVYRWNHTGTGPAYSRLGRHVRYRPAAVEAWLNASTVKPGGNAA